jgi:hypothetical protein
MDISRILSREDASPRISAMFYKATIQTVLLFGSETWVITDEILQMLTSFHHSVARRLTGRYPRPIADTNEWIHPSIQETLNIAGMFPMEEYLRRRREYLERYAQDLPILLDCRFHALFERTSRRTFWWNQPLANTNLLTNDHTDTNQEATDG